MPVHQISLRCLCLFTRALRSSLGPSSLHRGKAAQAFMAEHICGVFWGRPRLKHMAQMGLFGTSSGLSLDDENQSLMITSNVNHSRELCSTQRQGSPEERERYTTRRQQTGLRVKWKRKAEMREGKGETIRKGKTECCTCVSSSGNSKPSRLTPEQGGPFILNDYQTAAVSGCDFLQLLFKG